MPNDHVLIYLEEVRRIAESINPKAINELVELLLRVREKNGRIFFLGVGGSAANASHAVNDFRKICGFEAYAPSDNIAELTARVNDDGWDSVFASWLVTSRLNREDLIFIFSVGGGNRQKNLSVNIVNAIDYTKSVGAKIAGVVGRSDGYTAQQADVAVVIPVVKSERITAHAEEFQAVVWHLLVSHPKLQTHGMKWETIR